MAKNLLFGVEEARANRNWNSWLSYYWQANCNPSIAEDNRIRIYRTPNHDGRAIEGHGKVHRRGYLIDKRIRFNNKLTIHEDSFFNILAQKCSKDVKYCQSPFYLWKWRDESVCRHDPLYLNKTYVNMLDSNTALVEEFKDRNMNTEAVFYSTMMLYDCYYSLNCDRWWEGEGKDYLSKTEKRIKQYYTKFKSLIDTCDESTRNQIIVGIKNRYFQEGLMLERITFADWIKHIEKIK